MTKKEEIGKFGEDRAAEYLIKLDYRVLERNYRKKFGEIDIIAKAPDSTLIFIEVKTILLNEWVGITPEDNFTTHKLDKVKRTSQFFVGQHPELIDEEMGWRIDLITVEVSKSGKFVIRHYENV